MRKRLIIGLIIGATVFATVFAFAASLTVNGDNLQAGANANNLVCDADGVDVDWTVAWDTTQYEVATVKVSGIAAACDNHDISVTLEHTGGPTTVNDAAYTTGGTSVAIDVSANNVSAAELSTGDVNVAITE